MPFINTKTNLPLSKEAETALKTSFGEAIGLIGKSEPWLMVQFEADRHLWMAGSDAPAAMVEVDLYGAAAPTDYEALTARITAELEKHLALPAERIYVRYLETRHWGWRGGNF